MDSNTKSIKKGVSVDVVIFVFSIFLGFALIPIYLNYISLEEYGIVVAVQGIIALLSAANIGTSLYTTKKLSDKKFFMSADLKAYLSTAQTVQYIIAVVFVLIGFIVVVFVGEFLSVNEAFIERTKYLFLLSWAAYIVRVSFSLNDAVLRSQHHLAFSNVMAFGITLLSSIFNIIFLELGYGFEYFGVSLLIATIIVNIINLAKVMFHYRLFIHIPTRFEKSYIREGWSYLKQFQILKIAQISKTSLFTVLLSNFAGPATVALYNIANKVPQMIPALISKLIANLFPSLSSQFARGEIRELRKTYRSLFSFGVSAVMYAFVCIYLLNEKFILLWVGEGNYIGDSVLIFILINMAILSISSFTGIILQTSGKFQMLPRISVFEVLGFAICSSFFYQSFGLIGLFECYLLFVSVGFIYSLVQVLRIVELTVNDYLKAIYGGTFVAILGVSYFFLLTKVLELYFATISEIVEFSLLFVGLIFIFLINVLRLWREKKYKYQDQFSSEEI